MRTSRQALIVAAFLAMLAGGCSTTSGRCEDFCKWGDDCAGDPASNCQDNCESKYDNASDGCQEAFDEFADCLSDNDLNCTKVENSCSGSVLKFLADCQGQLD